MPPRKDMYVRLERTSNSRRVRLRPLIGRLSLIAMLGLAVAAGASKVYGATRPSQRSAHRLALATHGLSGPTATTGTLVEAAPGFPPGVNPGPSSSPAPRVSVSSEDLNVLEDHAAHVSGVLQPALAGQPVALQVRRARHWRTVATALTGARGRFALRYVPRAPASEPARVTIAARVGAGEALVAAQCAAGGQCAATQAPEALTERAIRELGTLNVYRVAVASWYGGGGELACGGMLTSSTMGVANKTLPCGTLVTLRYEGRTVRVPVIDRGPFVPGREFDLTEATKNALDFPGLGPVWSTR
jgi:rare lipoprotein A